MTYLADVLNRLPTYPARRIADLLPENWAATVGAPDGAAPPARLPEFTLA